jgi:hypothetical protein
MNPDGLKACSYPAGAEQVLSDVVRDPRCEWGSGFGVFPSEYEGLVRPFVRNVYHLIHAVPSGLAALVSSIGTDPAVRRRIASLPCEKGETFRIWPMMDNQPASPKAFGIRSVEDLLAASLGLTFTIISPRYCFYLSQRRDGRSWFLLTSWTNTAYEPVKGELAPETAHLLCHLAGIGPDDSVLDPFAGYGSIPRTASLGFGCTRVMANDIDPSGLHDLPEGVVRTSRNFLDPGSYGRPTKIVTDPPWGDHREMADKERFYSDMIQRCAEVLGEKGRFVFLSANDPVVIAAVRKDTAGTFEIEPPWPMLVRGKKTLVWRLTRV